MEVTELETLRIALEESVHLQSSYARLLNIYDGGARLTFKSAEEWVERLAVIGHLGVPKSKRRPDQEAPQTVTKSQQ